MLNLSQEIDNLLKYYTQKKQRIDLYLNMNSQKVAGLTKLIFESKNEIFEEIPEILTLYLNAENMKINHVQMKNTSKKDKEFQENMGKGVKGSGQKNLASNINLIPLEFKNFSTYDYKNYLNDLYENIEDLESFKNLNRVEWETRQKGNLAIKIQKKYLIDKNAEINAL